MSLYFVHLRRPAHLEDRRDEPFWEFGSFGRTGCHRSNLLSRQSPLAAGDRLAFLQGGAHETRIVGVTPPLRKPDRLLDGGALLEVNWDPGYRPLPYGDAPLLINNRGATEFPAVVPLIRDVARSTWCAKVASKFRSRTTPVPEDLEREVCVWFSQAGLPRVENYPDAVTAAGTRWHEAALKSGWARPDLRRQAYTALSGGSWPGLQADPAARGSRTGCRSRCS